MDTLERIKTYYLSKNISVTEMIKHVMKITQPEVNKDMPKVPEKLLEQSPETLDNLLKFLVKIVMHKQELTQ